MITLIRGHCPFCYKRCSHVAHGETRPRSGDLAMCGGCGEFSIFDFKRRRNVLAKPEGVDIHGIHLNIEAQQLRRRWCDRQGVALQ